MKEQAYIAGQGGKRVYASDVRDAQLEVLQPLQALLKPLGSFIISGCEVTANIATPSNFDVSSGFVAINHADGFKIARFDGVTNVANPGYLSISKTTLTGPYGTPPSTSTNTVAYEYKAVHSLGTIPSPSALYLQLLDPSVNIPLTLDAVIGSFTFTQWVTFAISVSNASGSLQARINKASGRLQITGSLLIKNMGAWATDYEDIIVLPLSTIQANATIGKWVTSPLSGYLATCPFLSNTGLSLLLEDANNKTIITHANAQFDSNGLTIKALRSDGNTNYYIAINAEFDML